MNHQLTLPARTLPTGAVCRLVGITEKALRRLRRIGCPCDGGGTGPGAGYLWDAEEVRRWRDWSSRRRRPTGTHEDNRAGVIYAICDPRNGAIRYIGKARDFFKRQGQHLGELEKGEHGNPYLQRWFNKLKREGREPGFRVLQECLPFTLNACEVEWIARGRRKGWKLCNIGEGGDGGPLAEQTKARLREISKAKWADPIYRKNHEASRVRRFGIRKPRTTSPIPLGPSRSAWEEWRQREAHRWSKTITPLTCKGIAFVPLTNSKWAMIDAADWPRVSQHRWSANQKAGRKTWRAKTKIGLLNRFVVDATEGQAIRHRNSNQLDCRRANLLLHRVGYREPLTHEQSDHVRRTLDGVSRAIANGRIDLMTTQAGLRRLLSA
jgi:hypothetical protein